MYMIKDLQKILNLAPTGTFDSLTLAKAVEHSKDTEVIIWVQKFLNSLDHEVKVGRVKVIDDSHCLIFLSGEFDRATRDLLTYFQKEYWMYKRIPVTAQLDSDTWELISAYLES